MERTRRALACIALTVGIFSLGGCFNNPPTYVSMEPCGGDLPPCFVKARESGGDYRAQNPGSSASGAWQFLDSTWDGYGGYSRAADAPPAVQDARAREVWAGGAGCSAWSAC